MITDYNEYLRKIDELKNEQIRVGEELEKKFREDLENEVSKYLDSTIASNSKNAKIFLIDDDYGFMINSIYQRYRNEIHAELIPVYKMYDDNRWSKVNSTSSVSYNPEKDDMEDFIKKYIDNSKKKNIKRRLDKESREFKKSIKKYNL